MSDVVKHIEIAALVWGDAQEVWEHVVRALAAAAVETKGKALWLDQIGDSRASSVMDAARIIDLIVADVSDAVAHRTSENK
jgi:hypothetical protein